MENGEEDVDLNMAFNLLAMQPSLMSCSMDADIVDSKGRTS